MGPVNARTSIHSKVATNANVTRTDRIIPRLPSVGYVRACLPAITGGQSRRHSPSPSDRRDHPGEPRWAEPLPYRPLRNRETLGPCSGPLARKDFGAQLVVSLIGKPL